MSADVTDLGEQYYFLLLSMVQCMPRGPLTEYMRFFSSNLGALQQR